MQTTLLGLAFALILALLAALVGPYFVDWNQFRPQFEAEAVRILGAPVRVVGSLDARLLPTPSLMLRDVTVGGGNDSGRVHAGRLDVQFSLGSLMRGEWRADELSIDGVSVDLGLDTQGRIDGPAAGLANLSALTIDRFNLTGRIALHDAASRSTLELNDMAFSGELRAQSAALRGDGNFLLNGNRTPFRLSAGRAADGKATRLHLTLTQPGRGVAADLDGQLAMEAQSPRFEGALALASLPDDDTSNDAPAPWRVSAKVSADPAAAKLDQLELSYGAAEKASKLSGAGEVRFGAAPHLDANLSARQIDADRLLSIPTSSQGDAPWLPRLRQLAALVPQAPLPVNIAFDAEQVTLGGRPLTEVAAQLRSDGQAWRIDRLNLRAPGGSQVALSGGGKQGAALSGMLDVQSADPDLLTAWLSARPLKGGGAPKPLHANGTVSVSDAGFALDPVKFDVDGGTLSGRLAYRPADSSHGSRIEIGLKGDSADLDTALNLGRSFSGAGAQAGGQVWPDEASIALDLGNARWGDQKWQPLIARFDYTAKSLAVNQVKLGSGGAVVEGHGTLDRLHATGRLSLDATAASLAAFGDSVAPYAPLFAERMKAMGDLPGPVRASLSLALSANTADQGHVDAKSSLAIDTPRLKVSTDLKATAKPSDIRDFNLDALSHSDVALDSKIAAERGQNLLTLFGLDRAIAAGDAAATLDAHLTGAWRAPLKFKARLTGAALDLEADGRAEPWTSDPKLTLALDAARLDLSPLLDLGKHGVKPISLKSQLSVDGRKWTFGDIDANADGSRMRGRLAVTLGDQVAVEGEAGVDALPIEPAIQLALGAAGRDREEPLGRGLLRGWHGNVAFQALLAQLPGGAELQPLTGTVRNDGQALVLSAIGKLGGGDAKADFTARPADNGVAINANVAVTGADGAALRDGDLVMPADKASVQMTLASGGRSASALVGALSGGGTASLAHAHIDGLDPKAFAAAIAVSDAGQPTDGDRLNRIVEPVLAAGALRAERVQFSISLADGRLTVAPTTLQAEGARAVVSGGYDMSAGQADLRANLVSTGSGSGPMPELSIFAAGPPNRLVRSVDVSALSTWLAVRRIDRETEKLQSLQRATPLPPLIAPDANKRPSDAQPQPADSEANAPGGGGADSKSSGQGPQGASASIAPAQVPDAEPRRIAPTHRLHAPRRPALPQASNTTGTRTVAPLPPPLDIRPAPSDSRLSRPRPPLAVPQIDSR